MPPLSTSTTASEILSSTCRLASLRNAAHTMTLSTSTTALVMLMISRSISIWPPTQTQPTTSFTESTCQLMEDSTLSQEQMEGHSATDTIQRLESTITTSPTLEVRTSGTTTMYPSTIDLSSSTHITQTPTEYNTLATRLTPKDQDFKSGVNLAAITYNIQTQATEDPPNTSRLHSNLLSISMDLLQSV